MVATNEGTYRQRINKKNRGKCRICGNSPRYDTAILVVSIRTTVNPIHETEVRLPLCNDCGNAARSGRIGFSNFVETVTP